MRDTARREGEGGLVLLAADHMSTTAGLPSSARRWPLRSRGSDHPRMFVAASLSTRDQGCVRCKEKKTPFSLGGAGRRGGRGGAGGAAARGGPGPGGPGGAGGR